ncbi:hypothetical protein HAX54_001256, partial [Datura stramonium]|nr:hypothetical protein [Datura stramonium]
EFPSAPDNVVEVFGILILRGFAFGMSLRLQKKVREYLDAPNRIEEDLMALRKIKLEGFVNTITERLFMKLMLARCSSPVQ